MEKKEFNLHDDHDSFFTNDAEKVNANGEIVTQLEARTSQGSPSIVEQWVTSSCWNVLVSYVRFRTVILRRSSARIWKDVSAEVAPHPPFLRIALLCFFLRSSYPFSEEHDEARSYLRARCPAWCDRILLSHSFKSFVDKEVLSYLGSSSKSSVFYLE